MIAVIILCLGIIVILVITAQGLDNDVENLNNRLDALERRLFNGKTIEEEKEQK